MLWGKIFVLVFLLGLNLLKVVWFLTGEPGWGPFVTAVLGEGRREQADVPP